MQSTHSLEVCRALKQLKGPKPVGASQAGLPSGSAEAAGLAG